MGLKDSEPLSTGTEGGPGCGELRPGPRRPAGHRRPSVCSPGGWVEEGKRAGMCIRGPPTCEAWLVCTCVRCVCPLAHVWGKRNHFHQYPAVSWWWAGLPRPAAQARVCRVHREAKLSPNQSSHTWKTHNTFSRGMSSKNGDSKCECVIRRPPSPAGRHGEPVASPSLVSHFVSAQG